MQEQIRKYKYYLLVGGTILFVSVLWFLQPFNRHNNQHEIADTWISESNTEDTKELKEQQKIYVDIKGAVKKPGVYEVKKEMRVWDALYLAGGATEDAETKSVNFSQKISDQMVIYIPKIGEEQATSSTVARKQDDKININQADETTLQKLSGIGLKKAQEIIKYREEHGGFQTIDELKNISGIGEKTVEKLKENISIS